MRKHKRSKSVFAAGLLHCRRNHIDAAVDPALIERFSRTMRENFRTRSVPSRKAYLQSLINVIEVDDHQIRIKGSKELLERAVLASQNGHSWCSQMSCPS
jgi:hypothetical protein